MANCGWTSELGVLVTSDRALVLKSLRDFIQDASQSQVHALGNEPKNPHSAGCVAISARSLLTCDRDGITLFATLTPPHDYLKSAAIWEPSFIAENV